MRYLNRETRLAPDSDGLPECAHHLVSLVAYMAHVDTVITGRAARKRDHLFGRTGMADVVFEAGREPECSLAHSLLDEPRHLLDLLACRMTVITFTHHALAHCRMADEREDVECDMPLLARSEVIRDGPRRVAVRPHGQRRDSLRHLACGSRLGLEPVLRVIMNIDKSRRDDHPARLDHLITRRERKSAHL